MENNQKSEKNRKLLSFVIPCYRSQKTIGNVVKEIQDTMKQMEKDYRYEIILVNDGSPDETGKTILHIARSTPNVKALDLAKNFGQHAAIMAGLHQVKGEYIVCLDDDGQTPADEVGKLLEKIDEGYDVVYASYDHKQHNKFRNIGSYLNGVMLHTMLGKPKELYTSSYFAARRFIVDEMLRYEHSYPYVMGLVLRTTRNICNVPVHHRNREVGESGYSIGKLLGLWLNGFTSFSIKPLRIAMYAGVFSAVCGFGYFVYILVRYFTAHSAPIGWSSTIAINLLLGGMILIVLGLIGEYVGRIFMCTNATPQYVIREIASRDGDEEEQEQA